MWKTGEGKNEVKSVKKGQGLEKTARAKGKCEAEREGEQIKQDC